MIPRPFPCLTFDWVSSQGTRHPQTPCHLLGCPAGAHTCLPWVSQHPFEAFYQGRAPQEKYPASSQGGAMSAPTCLLSAGPGLSPIIRSLPGLSLVTGRTAPAPHFIPRQPLYPQNCQQKIPLRLSGSLFLAPSYLSHWRTREKNGWTE